MENKEVKNKKIKHINQILCVINQYCDYMESFDRLLCSKIVILIVTGTSTVSDHISEFTF